MMKTISLSDEYTLIREYRRQVPVRVFDLARDLGLDPRAEPMADQISGSIRRTMSTRSGYRIAYNDKHHLVRQRFTVAHEIGHYILHRDLLADGVGDTVAYRDDGSGMPNPAIGLTEERQANTFAANVLMPEEAIHQLRARNVVTPEELARNLGVSVASMRIRLGMSPR